MFHFFAQQKEEEDALSLVFLVSFFSLSCWLKSFSHDDGKGRETGKSRRERFWLKMRFNFLSVFLLQSVSFRPERHYSLLSRWLNEKRRLEVFSVSRLTKKEPREDEVTAIDTEISSLGIDFLSSRLLRDSSLSILQLWVSCHEDSHGHDSLTLCFESRRRCSKRC